MTSVVSLDHMLAGLENAGVSAFDVRIENGQFSIHHRTTAFLTFLQHHANLFSEAELLCAVENSIKQSHQEEPLAVFGQFTHEHATLYWTCQLSRVQTVVDEHLLYLPDAQRQDQFLAVFTWSHAEHDLSEHFFRTIVENSPDVTVRLDNHFKIIYINQIVEQYTGINASRFIGKSFDQLEEMPEPLINYWHKTYQKVLETGKPATKEFDFPTPFGTMSFLSNVVPEFDQEGNVCTLLSISRNISAQKQLQRELHILASTDPLTNTFNRRHFLEKGQEELQRARRYLVPFSLLLIDLDNFKQINDSFGHAFGDEVLRTTSNILIEEVRESDIIGRLGGDEFCVLLVNTQSGEAKQIANRILKRVRAIKGPGKQSIAIGASIGIAEWQINDATLPCLINRADTSMYRAKSQGKDCVFVDDPS